MRKKNAEVTERRVSIMKCDKKFFDRGCENSVGLSTCGDPVKTAEYIWSISV